MRLSSQPKHNRFINSYYYNYHNRRTKIIPIIKKNESRLIRKNNRKFSTLIIPKTSGEHNYHNIQTIHNLAAIDAASVETTRRGGKHGYLAIFYLTMNHVTPLNEETSFHQLIRDQIQ